jgi:histidinol-phosphate aminotransferase
LPLEKVYSVARKKIIIEKTRTMSAFQFKNLLRPNIRTLTPYSSARNEYSGSPAIYLDANENAIGAAAGSLFQRYPDPLQQELKKQIARMKNVAPQQIFLGNGSDEAIDLLIRAVCTPATDNILIFPPTYGMYEVAARINDIAVKKLLLNADFQLDRDTVKASMDQHTRIVFFCSPNNPTGNLIHEETITAVLEDFSGLVVVDEAYIDFSSARSWTQQLSRYPNLVILQTFSKAWGMAGLRLGMAIAAPEIINVLNQIKAPYNISAATQQLAAAALKNSNEVEKWIALLGAERTRLAERLTIFPFVKTVFPSEANFLLIRVEDAKGLYHYLLEQGIVVRDRSNQPLCKGCLRVTVGTPEENDYLIRTLTSYKP